PTRRAPARPRMALRSRSWRSASAAARCRLDRTALPPTRAPGGPAAGRAPPSRSARRRAARRGRRNRTAAARAPRRRPGLWLREVQRLLHVVQAVEALPRELLVRAPEVPVGGGPAVDGLAQVEVADDGRGPQVEDLADGRLDLAGVDLGGPER